MTKKSDRLIPGHKEWAHPGGLSTNANPNHGDATNGMDFDRTMVDQYFADRNAEDWAAQDCASGIDRGGYAAIDAEWSQQKECRRSQVEESRFIHHAVAKPSKGTYSR